VLPRNPLDICRVVLMPRPILFSRGPFYVIFYLSSLFFLWFLISALFFR
jgi:hypothetical protein